MLRSRFPVRVTLGLASALLVSSLFACATTLTLLFAVAQVARAEVSCPPACVECNAKSNCVWYRNFCFCTIDPDKNVLSDLDVPDPVLT